MVFDRKISNKIKDSFLAIQDKRDLLDLLNYVKRIVYPKLEFRISLDAFTYYSNPELPYKRYSEFSISKKSGSLRVIHAPTKTLKLILKLLNIVLNCVYDAPDQATGFIINRSIVDNASKHVGKNFVFNTDLKDFFHSFDRNKVKLGFMRDPISFRGSREPLAFFLAGLTTHPINVDGKIVNVLPQGSPTSPVITNILCQTLDRRLNGLAKRFGAIYSRYADDITFSSNSPISTNEEFIHEMNRIISDQCLEIQEKKTREQHRSFRQEATGLVVNEKVNVKRRYIKEIRMWLYYWEKYGQEKAQNLFINDYVKDKGHVKSRHALLRNVIEGKLQFLSMVRGMNDPVYRKLYRRYLILLRKEGEQNLNEESIDTIIDRIYTDGLDTGLKMYERLKQKKNE